MGLWQLQLEIGTRAPVRSVARFLESRFVGLHADDFSSRSRKPEGGGVRFIREPCDESYGTVAAFEDLYGNKWDLLQLK